MGRNWKKAGNSDFFTQTFRSLWLGVPKIYHIICIYLIKGRRFIFHLQATYKFFQEMSKKIFLETFMQTI